MSAFIAQYPEGLYASLARGQLNKIALEDAGVAATEKARLAEEEKSRLRAEAPSRQSRITQMKIGIANAGSNGGSGW